MAEQIMITIVDDEQDMRESISQWLSLSGYKTVTYPSADLALKNIDTDYPGIIISDIKMPGTDGISFLKKLQKIDNALPVILITGHGDVSMAVEAMRIGAYDFLEKPFNPERMAELAKRAVQTRYLTLENRSLRTSFLYIGDPSNKTMEALEAKALTSQIHIIQPQLVK